ncbi:MAG: SDR family oxidoreductase [Rectinemataceae bacterium]
MNIAVTGATGHLGRLAVKELLEKLPAANIVAVVRDRNKAAEAAAKGVQVRVADYEDPAALKTALSGVDRLLLISSSEVGKRFAQHRNVIDAAKAAGVKYIVYTSAPKATTSSLILAPEHKATEEYLAKSGLSYAIVRHGWYTENYTQQIETSRRTGTVVAAAGNGRVASATRADYAAGDIAVLLGENHEGKTYEFSGDYAWDYIELASAIADIIGKPVRYQPVDVPTLIGILKGAGLDEGMAGFVAALDGNIAAGLLAETSGQLSALIGRPTTPLKAGLKASLARPGD